MVQVASYLRRLKSFDTITPFPLESRPAGIYNYPFLIEGNSILSTIFVSSIDLGATVNVDYVDYTTGEDVGEEYPLISHRQLSTALDTDRITVTRIHNKPMARVTVTGGSAVFSLYITVVASFASDLDAALKLENQNFLILRDKGMPIMGLDDDENAFNFIRSNNGRLLVEIVADTREINKRLYNENLGILPAASVISINYTVPTGKRFIWISGFGSSNCQAEWKVKVDGAPVLTRRSNYDEREVKLDLNYPFILNAGQNIEVEAWNRTIRGFNADIETWIYGFEEIL